MVMAVGVPRCSCSKIMSDKPLVLQERTSSGRMVLPLFSRIAVGIRSRTSFEKAASLLEGDREVVTSTRGSTIPERAASATGQQEPQLISQGSCKGIESRNNIAQ